MTIALSLAILVGLLNCYRTISYTRSGILPPAKPSKDLFSFLLVDYDQK